MSGRALPCMAGVEHEDRASGLQDLVLSDTVELEEIIERHMRLLGNGGRGFSLHDHVPYPRQVVVASRFVSALTGASAA